MYDLRSSKPYLQSDDENRFKPDPIKGIGLTTRTYVVISVRPLVSLFGPLPQEAQTHERG